MVGHLRGLVGRTGPEYARRGLIVPTAVGLSHLGTRGKQTDTYCQEDII